MNKTNYAYERMNDCGFRPAYEICEKCLFRDDDIQTEKGLIKGFIFKACKKFKEKPNSAINGKCNEFKEDSEPRP